MYEAISTSMLRWATAMVPRLGGEAERTWQLPVTDIRAGRRKGLLPSVAMRWERARPWVQAVGAGVSLALALPGPALVPLVLVVPGLLRRALAGLRPRRAFLVGWVGGVVQWAIAVAWVLIVLGRHGGLAWPLAVVALAIMSGILGWMWALTATLVTCVPERWHGWLLPWLLVCLEMLQHLPPWIFPWNPVAAVATPLPWLMLPLPVVAAPGLSLLLLLAGSGLDLLLDRGYRRWGALQLALVGLVFAAASALAPPFRAAGEPLVAAAVQPNVPLEVRWEPENERMIEERVWRLSAEAAARKATLVVWPESAVPRYLQQDGVYRQTVEGFTRRRGVWLVIGSIGFGQGEDEYFNSVFVAAPGGLVPYRYDKIHLVPFGEYLPLVGKVPFLRPLVREVSSFTPGTHALPLPAAGTTVGLQVCYEVTYPSLVADEVRRGAELLVTITNDGWYGDSAAPRQHLALAILRAAESRRFMVRAANTGISAIIGPDGRVLERLGVGLEGVIQQRVQPGRGVTPAVAGFVWIRAGILLVAAGAILCGAWKRRRGTP